VACARRIDEGGDRRARSDGRYRSSSRWRAVDGTRERGAVRTRVLAHHGRQLELVQTLPIIGMQITPDVWARKKAILSAVATLRGHDAGHLRFRDSCVVDDDN